MQQQTRSDRRLIEIRTTILVLIALVAGGTLPHAAAAADTREAARQVLAGLEQRWEAARQTLGVPGIAVAVVDADGVLLQCTLGLRDVARELPVTPDTMFYIASITKTYVATALAGLAESDRVDLDAKVTSLLPRFRLPDESLTESVTLRGLLSHQPGINSTPIVMLDAYTGDITEDRYYYWLEQCQATGRVGYTNVHFTLAGRVIESVTGTPWRDHLRERLFAPLGMHRTTGYADAMYADKDVAFPYIIEGEHAVPAPRKTDRTMHAAGGLGTSIGDAATYLRLQLGRGTIDGKRFLAPETFAEIHRDQSQLEQPSGSIRIRSGFGLGWMTGTYRGHRYLQHGGGYTGASAHFSFLPEHGYGVAILTNASGAARALGDVACIDVFDRLLGLEPEDLMPQVLSEASAPAEVSTRRGATAGDSSEFTDGRHWAGEYRSEHWGTVKISREATGLRVQVGDLATRLEPERRGRFALARPGGVFARGRVIEEAAADQGSLPRVDSILLEFGSNRARFDRVATDGTGDR